MSINQLKILGVMFVLLIICHYVALSTLNSHTSAQGLKHMAELCDMDTTAVYTVFNETGKEIYRVPKRRSKELHRDIIAEFCKVTRDDKVSKFEYMMFMRKFRKLKMKDNIRRMITKHCPN